ncbi:MAG: DUF4625 domain-containing protein [Bacteroidales bacterium]|nr:DUF4625 domain-containing protein [Bacteroidales bacterium]MBQ9312238.1 DUF4625 domain-containing protein [Bacteroidales bacterium]
MKNNIIKYFFAVFVTSCLLLSCNKKDEDKDYPTIKLTEVGHDNSMQGVRGDDMHLEATIKAENLIKRIDVSIKNDKDLTHRVEKSFTQGKYIGVKNTEFHEHIDIPSDMPLGDYYLYFSVVDKKDLSSTRKVKIRIVSK